jgi:hypothetical protein
VFHALTDSLSVAAVPAHLVYYPSGHDSLVWDELVSEAISWWLER